MKAWGAPRGIATKLPGPPACSAPSMCTRTLSIEHVERLVLVGVDMQGRGFAALRVLLEQQERPIRLLAHGLENQKVAVEPQEFALLIGEHDGGGTAHQNLLPAAAAAWVIKTV